MSKRFGFTLAEVLITLGIIGVVAALTIPTLVVDINAKQWSTAKDVFEKKLNESLKTMNTQQTISGHATTLSFVEELAKHFKINKICKNDDLQSCFSETVWWGAGEATPEEVDMTTIKQASHFGLDDWGTELIGVQFANGVTGLVAYNPICSGDPYSNQFNGTGCISVLYDTSGSKNPNTSGKDIGNYGVINRLGGATCAFEIDGICFTAPFIPALISQAECEARKSELGLTYCISDIAGVQVTDRYAATVAACGGIANMPTGSDLSALAKYLYNDSSISSSIDSFDTGVTLNQEKAASLGFTGTSFMLWTNEEDADSPAYRAFLQDRTYYTSDYDAGTGSRYGEIGNYPQICVYH